MLVHLARPWPIPKCSSAVAATLPAPPAALSPVNTDDVRRESMAVTTLIGNSVGANLAAAVTARERNDSRAISRDHAPATTCNGLHRYAPGCNVREPAGRPLSGRRSRLSYSSPVRLLFPSLAVRSRVRLFAFLQIAPLFEGRKQTAG
jgi:hypothetical protein